MDEEEEEVERLELHTFIILFFPVFVNGDIIYYYNCLNLTTLTNYNIIKKNNCYLELHHFILFFINKNPFFNF